MECLCSTSTCWPKRKIQSIDGQHGYFQFGQFFFLFFFCLSYICFDNTIYIAYPYTRITSRCVASRQSWLLFIFTCRRTVYIAYFIGGRRSISADRQIQFNIYTYVCIQYHRHGMNHFHLRAKAKLTELCLSSA